MSKELLSLDFLTIRVFVLMVELGSATEVANQLSLSKPKVSRSLAKLREVFGDELFVRSASGFKANMTALKLYNSARKIDAEIGVLSQDVSLGRASVVTLKIACREHLHDYVCAAVQAINRSCQFKCVLDLHSWTASSDEQLQRGQLDGVIAVREIGCSQPELREYPFAFADQLFLIGRRGHPVFAATPRFDDIFRHGLIPFNYAMCGQHRHPLEEYAQRHDMMGSICHISSHMGHIIDRVKGGDELTILPSLFTHQLFKDDQELEFLEFSAPYVQALGGGKGYRFHELCIQYLPSNRKGSLIESLGQYLKKEYQKLISAYMGHDIYRDPQLDKWLKDNLGEFL
ncbi:DNA-binding transcriptional regulator, LysR family [Ferrimonas sediminum]|uniref:DNA-binding transcriptional regulator, LysR family n=1 Tax=Ferrimonas sediminum TaxID=718193 RepID=A0A1G8QCB4_9GAMM|nr:LysR family transcriptional regulator [Ferrimonas sediminum]SDJ02444.1 DNA-binding transcriptional regulator, LysR family [Ferrimonas sediminum]